MMSVTRGFTNADDGAVGDAPADNPYFTEERREIQDAARKIGLRVSAVEIRQTGEIAPALRKLKSRADALFLVPDALLNTNRDRIGALALESCLPTLRGFREAVEAGGLLSYGPDYLDLFRSTADYVDKILKDGRPADLPVAQPARCELVINLRTARALGLTIPKSLLLRADPVVID